MKDINKIRKKYTEEIAEKIVNMSSRLQTAFTKVQKEKFLGPGPWKIFDIPSFRYYQTEDDNPEHIYHDVLIAIDEKKHLNNGQPSGLALWINSLNIEKNEKVLHIGCGLGYYTAIMAEMVGYKGEVTGLEIDRSLAHRAEINLKTYSNVKVLGIDGSKFRFIRLIRTLIYEAP